MTAPRHTIASLEAMSDRELDAAVHTIVMGKKGRPDWEGHFEAGVDYEPAAYSTSWDGFGEIFDRMRELGFALELSGFCDVAPGAVSFSQNHRYEWVHGDNLPRAAAIAAVLAFQGASE